jgi:hypothetical protein
MIEALGYAKGSDGFFRDPAGERLVVEVRMPVVDILQKAMLSVADNWQRIGVGAETTVIPIQRQNDNEYTATFPGFDTSRSHAGEAALKNFHSSEARLPEKRYIGRNYPNYQSRELDALIDRYLITIPHAERMQAAGAVIRHLTDQVVLMDLVYDAGLTVIGNRLQNVSSSFTSGAGITWNAHLWDVR